MNILLSSVGRRAYLVRYFRDAIAGNGTIFGANCTEDSTGMNEVDVPLVVPPAYTPGYARHMLMLCEKYSIDIFLSFHDLEPPFLAAHKEMFDKIGTRLIMADLWFIEVCLDKYLTAEFVNKQGLRAPKTFLDIEKAISSIESGEIMLPVMLKPRWGFGSMGLVMVYNLDELKLRYEWACRDVQNSLLTNVEGYDSSQSVMIQQVVNGPEYGLDIINDLNGNYVTCFIEHKLAMRSGETDIAMIVQNDSIEALGKKLGSLAKHPGVLDCDIMIQDDVPYIIEMNPRFGGHYPFAHLAGANIPAAVVAWAQGDMPEPEWLRAEIGVRGFKDLIPAKII